jgi:hypothetical protein
VPGEEVWTCGHPRGWTSAEAPVLCRGIVAGIAEERWANLEASWGNSGGGLVLVEACGAAVLGGVALGKAGDSHSTLEELRGELKLTAPLETLVEEKMKYAASELDALARTVEEGREQPRAAVVRKGNPALQESLRTLEQGLPVWLREVDRLRTKSQIEKTQSETLTTVLDFIDQHFRTGFVRFAGATAIRKLLGGG